MDDKKKKNANNFQSVKLHFLIFYFEVNLSGIWSTIPKHVLGAPRSYVQNRYYIGKTRTFEKFNFEYSETGELSHN